MRIGKGKTRRLDGRSLVELLLIQMLTVTILLSGGCSLIASTECDPNDDFCPPGARCVAGLCVVQDAGVDGDEDFDSLDDADEESD